MGVLRKKLITHPRQYIDPNPQKIPDWDYNLIYPITTYEAVHQTLEDDSTSLDQELAAIYRLINAKQDLLQGGSPGNLMVWGLNPGEVEETEIKKSIDPNPALRSSYKVVAERAIGMELDKKADITALSEHVNNFDMHVSTEDRERWDSAVSGEEFREHIENDDIHVTVEDKERWDGKADKSDLDNHLWNGLNPHGVTAHQVGTYTREEIDEFFNSLREAFFNYKNIHYVEATETATLEEYNQEYRNPNYILAAGDDLNSVPEQRDMRLTYFALKPATDYSTNPTNICMIYILTPDDAEWRQVGTAAMTNGDMVIRYPDTAMCVWIEGRFIILFTTSSSFPDGDFDGFLWRPIVDEDGTLHWTKSNELTPPDPINIKGEPGKTPVRGVDYFDGAPGIGVPSGGNPNDIIIKTDNEDYATKWVSLAELLELLGGSLPGGTGGVHVVQQTGTSTEDVMSQDAVTRELNDLKDDIDNLEAEAGIGEGSLSLRETLNKHLEDYENPHQVTPDKIGAVSLADFLAHTTNFRNPHNVSAAQVGLDQVNNTSDLNKPVSIPQQMALDALEEKFDSLYGLMAGDDLIVGIKWDDTTCTLTFTYNNGDKLDIVIPIITIFETLYYDNCNGDFVFTLPDKSQKRVHVKDLITKYEGFVSTNIEIEVVEGVIKGHVVAKSLTGDELVNDINLGGSPTTTTQLVDDNSDKIATTKFVKDVVIDQLDSYETHRPLSANMGRYLNSHKTSIEDVMNILADTPMMDVVDTLFSHDQYSALSANMGRVLNITKADIVHTSPSSSKYGRATQDLFGHVRASSVDPLMDGIPFVGTDDGYFARGDHRHATDSSRAPVFFPDELTGTDKLLGAPKAETPPDDSNDDRIVTTKWAREHFTNSVFGPDDMLKGEPKTEEPPKESDDNRIPTTHWVKERIQESHDQIIEEVTEDVDSKLQALHSEITEERKADLEELRETAKEDTNDIIDERFHVFTEQEIIDTLNTSAIILGLKPAFDAASIPKEPTKVSIDMNASEDEIDGYINWLDSIGAKESAQTLWETSKVLNLLKNTSADNGVGPLEQGLLDKFKELTGTDWKREGGSFDINITLQAS